MGKKPKIKYGQEYYQGKSTIVSMLFTPITNFFYLLRNLYIGPGEKELWIDVGAGDGAYLKRVNAKQKIGVEASSVARKMMERRGIKTMTPHKFLQGKNLEADVISFWQVLEHIGKPWLFLQAARHNIKRNGKIVIGIPNIDSFEFRLFGESWFHLAPRYHLWHFSPKAIGKLLAKEGFRIKFIDYFAPEHHLTGLIQSIINKTAGSRDVLHKIAKRQGNGIDPSIKDFFWIIFWMSLGLPIVFIFWILSALCKKSGTVVLVAKFKK